MRVATREEESLTIMTKHSTDKIIMDNYDVCVAQTLMAQVAENAVLVCVEVMELHDTDVTWNRNLQGRNQP